MSTTTQAARFDAASTHQRRPSARAPRPLALELTDRALAPTTWAAPDQHDRAQTIATHERVQALSETLLETERRVRAAGIVRLHCLLVAADGHAVRLAGERRGAPIVYGCGADLAEAMADLFRNVAKDGAL